MREFDIVVVGGGASGGLPAAAYLQRAGASVALVEQGDRCGTFSRTYERVPGARFDVSPVNFSPTSPAVADLDLAAHGYRLERLEVLYSTLDGAGRAITVYPNLERTAAQLARFSARDAAAFVRTVGGLHGRAREILSHAFFTPEPDLDAALEATAEAVGVARAELERLTAPALVERLFESEAVRISLTALPAVNLFGELLAPGQGALAWLWTFLLRSGRAPGGASSLPDAVEAAFLAHGGTLLRNATATRLVLDGGVCTGVEVALEGTSQLLLARRAVVSNVGADLTSELLGVELRSGWRTAGRTVFTADVVLDRPLRWTTEGDGFRASPRVYLLWSSWDECVEWLQMARDERPEVFAGHLELTQFSVLYGGRRGAVPLRVRFGTGPFGTDDWDARKAEYEAELRRRIAALDAEAVIHSLELTTPLDYWRMNPAARHGNPVGGDVAEGQWLGERLPYRSGIPRLYLSNSVWPTSLSWMAPGYNAATVVADDLDLREGAAWWSSPPLPHL